jgi:hypothetical protein
MILPLVVIDAHEEAAVLYVAEQVKKAMTTSFAKIFYVPTRASRSMGVGKREKRHDEKRIVSPGTGP